VADGPAGPMRPVAELVPAAGLLAAAPLVEPAAIQAVADGPRRIEAGAEPLPGADGDPAAGSSADPAATPPATAVLLPRAAASVVASPAAPPPTPRRSTQVVTERHEPASTVQVTIGRIEVRAASPVSAASERPSGPRGVMSLDEYVAQRRGSAR
jgi:hypothetical protein